MVMTSRKIYVGIDVSKNNLDVYVRSLKLSKCFSNSPEGIKALVNFLLEVKPSIVLLEATGGLEQKAARAMLESSLRVSVINPKRARGFANACDLAKTDKIDAAMLADFAYAFKDKLQFMVLSDESSLKIKALSTRRRQLLKTQTQEMNRLRWVDEPMVIESVKVFLEFIEQQISEIDSAITVLINQNELWTQKAKILQSSPGIGKVTANMLIASLPELGLIHKKKVTKLVGLAPINSDSGDHKGKRSIKGGRFPVRAALYMATLTATRYNPKIKAFYQKLLAKGKPKKVALTACMHKLLHILNAMLAKMEVWKLA
jgi:transposase